MRSLASVLLLATGLLASASASADDTMAEPPAAAPLPPAYPVALPGVWPGYPPPYVVYPAGPQGALQPAWMPEAPPTVRRSGALRTTGIVFFAAGGAVTTIGAAIFGAIVSSPCQIFDGPPQAANGAPEAAHERIRAAGQALNGCDNSPGLGVGIMAAGALTALVGIPLFVIGSKQVPARATMGSLAPEVTVGAGTGSLRWTF